MRNAIIELLNRANERKMRLIYIYTKALIGDDTEILPTISITDTDLRLSEVASKHITAEELEQIQTICRNIRKRKGEQSCIAH